MIQSINNEETQICIIAEVHQNYYNLFDFHKIHLLS